MAAEPWNKIHIPRPGAVSTVRIPFTDSTGDHIKCLLEECAGVLKVLQSDILHTEVQVLYSVLYVMNNPLGQHKPFRAVKQVERCINRLKEMKLSAALQDMVDMCPKEAQRRVLTQTGLCEVPSQPMLEWFCLKLLGACKLLVCLGDSCFKAFVLTRRHLFWSEYIVLNLVLSAILSRLWIFFQGALKNLAPLYQAVRALLQDVFHAQPMPFLTDFALPEDVPAFLGAVCWARIGVGLPVTPTTRKAEANEESQGPTWKGPKAEMSYLEDLGSSVLQRGPGGDAPVFDMKALLKRTNRNRAEITVSSVRMTNWDGALIRQKRRLLKQLGAVSSADDMAAGLMEAIRWCRRRKLRRESRWLVFHKLTCQRLKHLEAEGFRVKGKLRHLRRAVRKALFLRLSSQHQPPCLIHRKRRTLLSWARFGFTRWSRWPRKWDRCCRQGRPSVSTEIFTQEGGGEGAAEEEDRESGGADAGPGSGDGSEIDYIFASLGF